MPRRLVALAAIAALVFAACGRDAAPPPPPTPAEAPRSDEIVVPAGKSLIIGVSAALDGDQRDLGVDLVAGAQLAAGQFGNSVLGHPIELSARDDGCADPEKAVAVAGTFIADAALAGVIGPMCTTGAQAANPRYEAAGVVHISASATRSNLSAQGERFFFRTVWHDDVQAAVQSDYAREELGAGTAVVLGDGEPYGNALAREFGARFQDAGGRVLADMRVERGTSDFSSIARQIVDAAPDVVVFEGFNPEGPLLARALGEAEYEGFFVGPDGMLNARDFLETAGAHAEGATITGGALPEPGFVEMYEALYQRPPTTAFVLQAHDAVTALLNAIKRVGVEDEDGSLRINRDALAAALRDGRFAGLTGSVAFDERGERRGETPSELGVTVYRVFGGALVAVE
jgi:branched-chain amino acid transport system substrate-binding protein